jgi:hypothetical protein
VSTDTLAQKTQIAATAMRNYRRYGTFHHRSSVHATFLSCITERQSVIKDTQKPHRIFPLSRIQRLPLTINRRLIHEYRLCKKITNQKKAHLYLFPIHASPIHRVLSHRHRLILPHHPNTPTKALQPTKVTRPLISSQCPHNPNSSTSP